MTRFKPTTESGLTLVEILVALTLLGVVLLPVVSGLSQALVTTSDSTITTTATSIARDKVEQLKADIRRPGYDFNSLVSKPREPADYRPGDGFFEVEQIVEITRPDDAAHSGLKKVDIIVYRTGSNKPVVALTTYLMPYGI
jgi:prepilin-type N-terminal cleavage/methylation domain-containing protein